MIAFAFSLAGPDIVILFILFLLLAPFLGFVIWMIVDCVKYETNTGNMKLIWVMIILLLPFGSFVYLFARKLGRDKTAPGGPPSIPRL
jgi:Phospholipase_D-nuclease N-terminal